MSGRTFSRYLSPPLLSHTMTTCRLTPPHRHPAVALQSPPPLHQIKAKALKRAVDIGRPSIPPQQLQGLWAMAQENPDAIAQRFGAPKVRCEWTDASAGPGLC